MDESLREYVRKLTSQGVKKELINERLTISGYKQDKINQIFSELEKKDDKPTNGKKHYLFAFFLFFFLIVAALFLFTVKEESADENLVLATGNQLTMYQSKNFHPLTYYCEMARPAFNDLLAKCGGNVSSASCDSPLFFFFADKKIACDREGIDFLSNITPTEKAQFEDIIKKKKNILLSENFPRLDYQSDDFDSLSIDQYERFLLIAAFSKVNALSNEEYALLHNSFFEATTPGNRLDLNCKISGLKIDYYTQVYNISSYYRVENFPVSDNTPDNTQISEICTSISGKSFMSYCVDEYVLEVAKENYICAYNKYLKIKVFCEGLGESDWSDLNEFIQAYDNTETGLKSDSNTNCINILRENLKGNYTFRWI